MGLAGSTKALITAPFIWVYRASLFSAGPAQTGSSVLPGPFCSQFQISHYFRHTFLSRCKHPFPGPGSLGQIRSLGKGSRNHQTKHFKEQAPGFRWHCRTCRQTWLVVAMYCMWCGLGLALTLDYDLNKWSCLFVFSNKNYSDGQMTSHIVFPFLGEVPSKTTSQIPITY